MIEEHLHNHLIERHYSYPLPDGGAGHWVKFRTLDPKLILESTPVSAERDLYYSMVIHDGVGVVFSAHEQLNVKAFQLALSEGSGEAREKIVSGFSSAIRALVEQQGWGQALELDTHEKDHYGWQVESPLLP